VLLDTSADPEARAKIPRYRLLNFIARWFGFRPVVDRVMPILFGPTFLGDGARGAERAEYRSRLLALDRIGTPRAVRGVIEREGVSEQLHRIRTPTLVLVGEEDSATPPDRAQALAAGIAGARLVRIPGAGHTSTLEQPAAVSAEIAAFLAGLG
jgi:3-oxoadipate enol-lactonase